MKANWKVEHDNLMHPDDTVLEVLNYEWNNTVIFYSWIDKDSFNKMTDTIGMWKIKSLKS
jgi:hypothetical protein